MEARRPILVVEDAPDVRDAILTVLESEGYRTLAATDGQQALDDLTGGEVPCLILLDLMMPGKTGWEFRADQLKNPRLATIPVVICSASTNVEYHAERLGVSDVLEKPLDIDRLLAVVARYAGPGRPIGTVSPWRSES